MYLFAFLVPSVVLAADTEESFFLIETNKQTDLDIKITSVGAFGLNNGRVGHLNLSYIESAGDGNTLALDLGGGVAYHAGLTYFFSVGFLLGYNRDNSDYIAAYYPEIGVVAQIAKTFGLIATGRKYSNLYSSIEDENIVMFGLLFGSHQ